MNDKVTFRAEVEFQGSPEELAHTLEGVGKLKLRLEVNKIPIPFHIAGGWPIPLYRVMSNDRLAKIVKGKPSFPEKILGGINGGIRGCHVHFDEQIVFVGREEFSKIVGHAAENIASELASEASYENTLSALHGLNEAVQGNIK